MELLVTRHDTEDGAAREQRLPGSVFQLGRGSQCEIHLPDARVALTHARLTLGASGATIEAVEQRFVHNDREVSGAQLAAGDTLEIGPYFLKVDVASSGAVLAIAVRLSSRVSTRASSNALFRVLTRAPRLSKRRLSYLAFFGTLLVTLLAPIASDLLDRQQLPLAEPLAAGAVQAWNPGELLRSHLTFAHECRACHKVAFQRVPDTACNACHSSVREHVASSKMAGSTAFTLSETRCAQCHRDHKGKLAEAHSDQLCAQCHARIEEAASRAVVQKVSDFGKDHPQFRLWRVGPRDPQGHLAERSNLKFNHTLHLDPGGVRDPNSRRRTVLACGDCHEAEDGGARIAPVSMERHCSSCHALTFEPQVTKRQVPHAALDEVERSLREFYARLVIGDVPAGATPPRDLPRLRPGVAPSPEERREAMRIADERARRAVRELVQTRAVCSTCHYVERKGQGERTSWTIAPVALTSAWMPAANFRHDKHAAQTCITCHDVRTSRRAEDVAMPDIARCRQCHAGAQGAPGKVASECAACHRFHGGTNTWH